MVFNNKYIVAIIALLLVAGVAFFIKIILDSKEKNDPRKFFPMEREATYSSPNTQGVYRLTYYQGSLLALTKNGGVVIDPDLQQETKVLEQSPKGRFSYYSVQGYDTASFDAKAGILRISSPYESREYKTNSATRNVIYQNPYFYFDYVYTDRKGNRRAELRSWGGYTDRATTVAHLSDLFYAYINPNQDCLASQFEGEFFNLGRDTWGYAFSRGSYFLIGQGSDMRIHRSVFDKGFIGYKTPDMEDGIDGYRCPPRNGERYYYDAAYYEGRVYALSAIVNKRGHADIDVYDVEPFKYIYTLSAPLKGKNSSARLIEILGHSLYLCSNDGEIIKFSKFHE
jgi:hypothetical protein